MAEIPPYTVRLMTEDDVQECLDIFAAHDMPEMKYGLSSYRKIEPEGCFVLVNDEDGTIISCCLCHTLDPRLAIVVLYGTKPGFQGKGLGIKTWKKVMEYIGPDKNIGLSSAPDNIGMYRDKAGFKFESSDGMLVMSSTGTDIKLLEPTEEERSLAKIIPFSEEIFEDLVKYDESITEYNRSKYLNLCLHEPETLCLVAVNPNNEKQVLGFAAMKPTNYDDLPILAPLYADSYEIAKLLLYNLMISQPISYKKGFRTFVMDSNPYWKTFVADTGLKGVDRCPHIFTKKVIECKEKGKVFSLISPGFGLF